MLHPAVPTRTRMTAEQYDQLPESNEPMQLIDGELVMAPAPIPAHQSTSGDVYMLVRSLIPNGRVFYAPIDVEFDAENIPQPDIVWVADNSRCRIGEKRLYGPPDLIVEVLSPGTALMDKRDKFLLYEKYAVSEYWIVAPIERYVEVYTIVDGRYLLQGVYGVDDSFQSAVMGGVSVEVKRMFTS